MARGHEKLETNIGLMMLLALVLISVGGIVTIAPLYFQTNLIKPVKGLKPYTPLGNP